MHRPSRLFAALIVCATLGVICGTGRAGPRTSADVVKVTVQADKPDGGKQVLTLTLDIAKGWHTYANPVGLKDFIGSQTTVFFTAGGKPVPAKVEYPKGKLVVDENVGNWRIY